MIFNTIEFLIYLVVVFFLYWTIFNKSNSKQNILLLFAGYFFYGWWSWKFLFLFIATSAGDFYWARLISGTEDPKKRKFFLSLSILVNLSVLGFFKYYNFFVSEFCGLFGMTSENLAINIVLPIGISFYTFQAMAYVIDVYRRKTEAEKNILTYLTFSSFFPQLLSGPIERSSHLLSQFKTKRVFNYDFARSGLELMLLGFLKKVVLADNFAAIADKGFSFPNDYHGIDLIIAVLCFTFQIYFDFSGYTDIARGVAKLFGVQLIKNFNNPYFSQNISDFWNRWHISLSSWFKDYLYIPIGGNKKNKFRTQLNLLITFSVSGLWHGANVTFVVWGLYHGMLSVISHLFKIKLPKFIGIIVTFLLVMFGWIFFRAANMNEAFKVIHGIVEFKLQTFSILNSIPVNKILFLVFTLVLVLFIERSKETKPEFIHSIFSSRILKYSVYYAVLFIIIAVGVFDNTPNFIYFQF